MEDDIKSLREDLINCPEYEDWDSIDQKLLENQSSQSVLLESFLATNFNYKRALQSARKFLTWKAENGINFLQAESFAKEMHSINFVCFLPADINGTPTLLLRLCFPSPPSYLLPYVYKYVSWNIEKVSKAINMTSRKPRLVIDCADARIDLTIIKEMLNILVFIYPPWVESVTFCNMDWKFSFIYSIIKKLLPSSIRELIIEADQSFVNSLASEPTNLPPYLGGLTFNCSYDDWIKCDNISDFLKEKGFKEKQINESIDYVNSVIKKFGNDAPKKF